MSDTSPFVLTSAPRGLGVALAQALMQPGHCLICAARDDNAELRVQTAAAGVALGWYQVDLSNAHVAEARMTKTLATLPAFAKVTLVFNAGAIEPIDTIDTPRADTLLLHLQLSLAGPMALTVVLLRGTTPWNTQRHVLAISSDAACRLIVGWAVYCAGKAGLDVFVRAINVDGSTSMRAVTLAPDVTGTDTQRTIRGTDFAGVQRFRDLRTRGELVLPQGAAARIAAYFVRPDFGATELDDLRNITRTDIPLVTIMTGRNNPTESNTAAAVSARDDNKIITERREKLAEIRQQNVVFPNDFRPTHYAGDLQTEYRELERAALEAEPMQVTIAERMMLKRVMGKASFATVQDSADHIRFYISHDAVGEDVYASFKKWNLGDIVAARGTLIKTKTGELSVAVTELRLLSRSLRPLPGGYYGLTDQEQEYHQRYIDLIVSKEARDAFRICTKAMASLRSFMAGNGFMEVETPILHPIPDGAAAKPFIAHHNASDMQMFPHIAPGLYLERLIVDGFERVYEINRSFRNEGVSPRYNPEFTVMGFYAAYTDCHWLMSLTGQLIRQAAIDTSGTATLTYQSHELDLAKPFRHLTICQAIQKYAPQYTDVQLANVNFLHIKPKKFRIDIDTLQFLNADMGTLQLVLSEETAESQLWEPTFIINYPIEVSPLARGFNTLPDIIERFELFITGREIANDFSELNDPEDQTECLRKQAEQKDAGDEETMFCDTNYIRTLEYGMPPTGDYGIGIDRLVMLLTDSPNIRDVILFPHLHRED